MNTLATATSHLAFRLQEKQEDKSELIILVGTWHNKKCQTRNQSSTFVYGYRNDQMK
jgi:hypothetical protein